MEDVRDNQTEQPKSNANRIRRRELSENDLARAASDNAALQRAKRALKEAGIPEPKSDEAS